MPTALYARTLSGLELHAGLCTHRPGVTRKIRGAGSKTQFVRGWPDWP